MKLIYLDKIKSYESSPKIVNIFSEKEIKMIRQLYADLPERVLTKNKMLEKKLGYKTIIKNWTKYILINFRIFWKILKWIL